MRSALFIKFPRILLAFSVSVWMAGGCLFGCSNMQVSAAETESRDTVVEGDSCEPVAAHGCCTKPKTAKQPVRTTKATIPSHKEALAATSSTTLSPTPHGMSDCPLMVNTTAVASKSSGNLPQPARTPGASLPKIESQIEQVPLTNASSYRPNRGPTHLRCCVFLI